MEVPQSGRFFSTGIPQGGRNKHRFSRRLARDSVESSFPLDRWPSPPGEVKTKQKRKPKTSVIAGNQRRKAHAWAAGRGVLTGGPAGSVMDPHQTTTL